MRHSIVLGLGFGDEGKGRTVDYLCKDSRFDVVVRFSGGQQCGHTVVSNGVKHTFSNFGSGTLKGVPSYFSEHCTFYPTTINREYLELKKKGIVPILFIHPLAKLTTPYDVAFNRINSTNLKHGSCGLGVGATMKRHNTTGFQLHAVDTLNRGVLEAKLKNLLNYYMSIVPDYLLDVFEKKAKDSEEWFDFYEGLYKFQVEDYSYLKAFSHIIYEGSQGIMLDAVHGIFPNVTYSRTVSKNALEIINVIDPRAYSFESNRIRIFYVTRCYLTRHGNGWMPHSDENSLNLVNTEGEINVYNQFQGEFRKAELDYSLIQHALDVDKAYHNNFLFDRRICVTCLDQHPSFDLKGFKEAVLNDYGTKNFILFDNPSNDFIFSRNWQQSY